LVNTEDAIVRRKINYLKYCFCVWYKAFPPQGWDTFPPAFRLLQHGCLHLNWLSNSFHIQ